MDVDQRMKMLEDELKVLKSEIKAVLFDIREQYLTWENPINQGPWLDQSGIQTMPPKREEPPSEPNKLEDREEPRLLAEALSGEKGQRGDSEESQLTGPVFKSNDEENELLPGTYTSEVKRQHNGKQRSEIDLATIAGLTRWVDQTTQRIGKKRTEALVEGLHVIEHLPPGIKDFLLKFIHLSQAREPQQQITTKDYLTVLTQLEGLLGQGSASEMALISILSNSKGDNSG